MRYLKFILPALLMIAACKCNNDNEPVIIEDSILVIPDTLLAYDVDTEAKTMKKYTEVPDSAFTAQRVVNGLNQKYPFVQIALRRQSNDTLYVAIPESEYLGEQMGNTGASAWFSDAVLNLTAVPGINYVNIEMEKRSHAQPGVFSKQNLEGYKLDTIPAN